VPHVFCRSCGLDLTHQEAALCPACGWTYAREELLRWAEADLPLPFGQTGDGRSFRNSIGYASLFTPTRLGRELPPRGNARTALRHATMMHLLSAAIVGAAALAAWRDSARAVLLMLCVLAGAWL
jgi:hypothetical protein